MSGPKISVYSLTGRARTIVIGQIACEQQSLACVAWTQEIVRSFQPFFERFDQQIRNIHLLMKRTSEGAGQAQELQAIEQEIRTEAAEIKKELADSVPHISEEYEITEEAYAEKKLEMQRLQALQKRAEKLQARLESASDQDLSFLQRNDEDNIQRIQAGILDDLSGVSGFEFEEDAPDTSFRDKKDAIRKELSGLLRDNSLPEHILSQIRKALSSLQRIGEMQYLSTFESVTVTGIRKKIEAYRHEEEEKEAGYKELFARYEALCTMAGAESVQLPYSESAFTTISAEVDRLETLLLRQREQAYISDCVDEVMEDMGYNLIGSREVRKKSGKRFRNELFTFNEGTAVNVTFSPDGQISMEIGGLAKEDRVPTVDEIDILTRDMESFCGEFAEFERRMLAKGIVVGSRIALSPPAAEYAAIINVNDYDIAESTQVSVMNATEKRRKQAEKKVMRRNE